MRNFLGISLLLFVTCTSSAQAYEANGFIRVCDGKFADADGNAWTFAGWNGITSLMHQAYRHLYYNAPDLVDARFKEAQAAGLTAVRIWGHGDEQLTLQTDQGVYDEKAFRSLDYVISSARKYNIRLLLSLTTYWQDKDGILAYAKWANLTYPITEQTPYYTEQWAAKDNFWTSVTARSYYKANMRALFNRKNTFNGIAYKDDWTIFGWGLFNEPRCPASQNGKACTSRITNWGNEMFAYARQYNNKQLFTFGEEGFFAKDGDLGKMLGGAKWWRDCNPYGVPGNVKAGWAASVGQDFKSQNQKGDFAELHLWPTNWQSPKLPFIQTWLQCHMKVCEMLKMPCVLGEFGRALSSDEVASGSIATIRDPYYAEVYKTADSFIANKQPYGGDLFWLWDNPSATRTPNSIFSKDSTFKNVIAPHGQRLKSEASGQKICAAIP